MKLAKLTINLLADDGHQCVLVADSHDPRLWAQVLAQITRYTTTPEPGATEHATQLGNDAVDDGRIDPSNILHHINPMDRLIASASVRDCPPASASPQTSTVDTAPVNSACRSRDRGVGYLVCCYCPGCLCLVYE